MTDCGAAHESCCTSLEVPGGTFYRTYRNDGARATREADPATVSPFRLDKYEVTVGRFRQFASAWKSGYRPPTGSGKHTHLNGGRGLVNSAAQPDDGGAATFERGWLATYDDDVIPVDLRLGPWCSSPAYATWTPSAGSHENLPINCVDWPEAYAFCIWDDGFLPSATEWSYAAAGGSEQRVYPWGAAEAGAPDEYAIDDCTYGATARGVCTGVANIAPVGAATRGAGRWGHLDLVGNVSERNLDLCAESFVNPCVDCAYLAEGDRMVQGGEFGTIPRPPDIYCASLSERSGGMGLRCARAP